MSFFRKTIYLLTAKQKRQLIGLSALLFVGFLFEMLGLGIIIPALKIILDSQISAKYPILKPFLDFWGNPSQAQLAVGVMVTIVLLYIVKAFYFIFMAWHQSNFSANLYKNISMELFFGYLTQPYAFHLQRNSAILIRNINVEGGAFLVVSQALLVFFTEAAGLLGIGIMLLIFEPLGTLVVFSFLALSAYSFELITRRKLRGWGKRRQDYEGRWNQQLMQSLGGVKVIKLTGREHYFKNIFEHLNTEKSSLLSKEYTLRQIPRLYLEVLGVLGLAGLIIVKVWQNSSLDVLIPTLGIFVTAAFRMMPSANRMMNSIASIRFYKPVVDLLYNECRLIRTTRALVPDASDFLFQKEIQLKEVSFQYEGADTMAVNNVSLTISKGESIGFLGTSGSGKSTTLDLILGLLSPGKGTVFVDGRNIQTNIRGWQNQIGYVPQLIYLMDDTIRNNIAFGVPLDKIDEVAVSGLSGRHSLMNL